MENNNLPDLVVPPEHNLPSPNLSYSYSKPLDDNLTLKSYWNILLKRKWWVIGTFLSMVVSVGIISFMMTPVYRATTILQITQDNPAMASLLGERDPFAALFAEETQGRFYETQYMLLNSRTMAYRIIDSLNLTESKEFKELKESNPNIADEEQRSKFADLILSNLSIKPLKRSFLVEVAFTWEDKQLAQQVLNVISEEYTKFCMDTRRQSYKVIKNWLESELQKLATKVEESEKKVLQHGKEKDFLPIEDTKDNTTINKYVKMNLLLTKGQSERMLKEAQYNQIKQKGVDAPLITNNPLVQRLREESIAQEAKVASLNKIFDKNYPQLQAERSKLNELNSRLNKEVMRIRNSIEADYQAALKAENLLQEATATQKVNVAKLQDHLVKHHILKRDMQSNEQLYQGLLSRMKETSVASTMVASNVAVMVPSELPLKPYKPRKLLNILIASVLGLVGGMGLAFLVEHFDDSLKTSEDMERSCQLATLGVIPLHLAGKGSSRENIGLVTYNQPLARITEAIRHVRTSVMLSSSGAPPKTLMITSPNANEGKTTIAVNIAISLALNGAKVVLVDGDLRKPQIHKEFQQEAQPGLSNFLSGNASLDEVIHPTEIPDLFIIPAGTIPPNPTELLHSRDFQDLLTALGNRFRHLIIDTPPIIEFADARAVSSFVDGVLLVFKYHSTSRESARLSKELLNQVNARVIGALLNMATTDRLGYYSGYYSYYSYYKRSYYNNDREIVVKNDHDSRQS